MPFKRSCLGLLFTLGCGLERAPTAIEDLPDTISVHSILVAGSDSAHVLITRTPALVSTAGQVQSSVPLAGATVLLINGDERTQLHPGGSCVRRTEFNSVEHDFLAGCYAAELNGGVRYATRYELQVDAPGYETIRGATTVPASDPHLEAPIAGATIVADGHYENYPGLDPTVTDARWRNTGGSAYVSLSLTSTTEPCYFTIAPAGESRRPSLELENTNEVGLTVSGRCDSLDEGVVDGVLSVFSYGTDYNLYLLSRFDRDIDRADASIGLTGAYGIFAAGAVGTVPVRIEIPKAP